MKTTIFIILIILLLVLELLDIFMRIYYYRKMKRYDFGKQRLNIPPPPKKRKNIKSGCYQPTEDNTSKIPPTGGTWSYK